MSVTRARALRVAQIDLDRAKRWPIGQPVTVTKDDGSIVETETCSEPWQQHGVWVILVNDMAGGHALAQVRER